jgi:hypothetical protein
MQGIDFPSLLRDDAFDRLVGPLIAFVGGEHEQQPESEKHNQRENHPDHPGPPAALHEI